MKDFSDIHSFVVCAYQESEFLEECVHSLVNQTVKSRILMVTSTPNEHIRGVADKYHIPLWINSGEGGIAQDWNFALSQSRTKYVTIAHQDDTYEPQYAGRIIRALQKQKKPLIAFSDYGELRNGRKEDKGHLVQIKRLMLLPMRIEAFTRSVFVRRRVLGLGNAICCPSVTYCMDNLAKPVFRIGLKSNLDWETWERLSREKGAFVYVSQVLMHHRIHEESTTSQLIHENKRGNEDYEMFLKFWPERIACFLTKVYSGSEKYNDVENK